MLYYSIRTAAVKRDSEVPNKTASLSNLPSFGIPWSQASIILNPTYREWTPLKHVIEGLSL
jgi:hypothetical protein